MFGATSFEGVDAAADTPGAALSSAAAWARELWVSRRRVRSEPEGSEVDVLLYDEEQAPLTDGDVSLRRSA